MMMMMMMEMEMEMMMEKRDRMSLCHRVPMQKSLPPPERKRFVADRRGAVAKGL